MKKSDGFAFSMLRAWGADPSSFGPLLGKPRAGRVRSWTRLRTFGHVGHVGVVEGFARSGV